MPLVHLFWVAPSQVGVYLSADGHTDGNILISNNIILLYHFLTLNMMRLLHG